MAAGSLRNRITIILYILSFTISVIAFTLFMNRVAIDIECTSYSQCAVDGSTIYYTQNMGKQGLIFKMNPSGDVDKIFSSKETTDKRVVGISAYQDGVYAVLSGYVEEDEKDKDTDSIKSTPTYTIVCLDKKLSLQTRTPRFSLGDEDILVGFSAEGTGLFMTMLTPDGSMAKVYSLGYENLKAPDDLSGDVKIEAARSKRSTQDRFYADALYQEGQLYVRTDADAPTGVFAVDPYISNLVANMRLSGGQLISLYSTYLIWYVAILLIWFILLYQIIRLFQNRNRSFYYLLIAEAVLFIIVATGIFVVCREHYSAREVEHSRFAVISLIGLADKAGLNENPDYNDTSFYNTDRYQEIRQNLCEFIKREGNSAIFYDVFVYRLRDNYICASGSGRNRETISDLYGQSLSGISSSIYKGNKYTAQDFKLEGQDYRAVAVTVDQMSPEYALVGIINDTTTNASVFVEDGIVLIFFLFVFALGSGLVVLIWFFHMRDLAYLEDALSKTALGGDLPERPFTLGRDIKDMWDSVSEIHKRIDEIEYSRVKMLEAYYRFAPKNVERFLGKESILEVHHGDRRDFTGTGGILSLDLSDKRKMKRIGSIVDSFGKYQKDHEAIVLGKSPDMSRFQILFQEQEKNTVRALIDMFDMSVKTVDSLSMSAILYYDRYEFGVMGSEEETTTYMLSDDQELYYNISRFITKLQIGLAVTKAVIERENITGALRFIGNAGIDSQGNVVKLYEVLDAYPSRIRNERVSTLPRYEEALSLFYEKDFYIARTKFSEILKDNPEDTLIKWYVFESDKYLNESVEGDDYKYLHF